MFIIWKGNGILLPIFGFLGAVAGSGVYLALAAKNGTYDGGIATRAMLIGVIAGTWVYIGLIGKTKVRLEVDPQTGAQTMRKVSPSLYFFPVKGWAISVTMMCVAAMFFDLEVDKPSLFDEFSGSAASGGGERSFEAAESWIGRLQGDAEDGNSDQARVLARQFSQSVRGFRNAAVEGGSDRSGSEFRTYCYLNQKTCAFLVRVPGLRKFSADAKDLLHTGAWQAAVSVCEYLDTPPEEIGVGVRGIVLYSGVMVGDANRSRPDVLRKEKALHRFFEGDAKRELHRDLESEHAPEPPEPLPPRVVRSLPTEIRTWTAADGRPLEASLTGFTNDDPPKAMFERVDGKAFAIGLAQFSPASRQEIIAYAPKDSARSSTEKKR